MRAYISDNSVDHDEYLRNCSFIKAILMLLVIIGHCCNFWTGTWFTQDPMLSARPLGLVTEWLNSFHIYAFTLISGYIYQYIRNEKGGYSEYREFVMKKAKRLIVPYCFAALVWIIPVSAYFLKLNPVDIAKRYILCTQPSQCWFLWMLFDVFIIVWPLQRWMEKDLYAVIIAFGSYGVGIIGRKILPDVFCVWKAFSFLSFFILGMKLREKKNSILYSVSRSVYLAGHTVLFIIWEQMSAKTGATAKILTMAAEYTLHIVGALAAFFIFQWLAGKINRGENKLIQEFSKRTMPMFLFHQQVIYFTVFWLNGRINPYLHAAVNCVAAISLSYIISSIMLKNKICRILVGEK